MLTGVAPICLLPLCMGNHRLLLPGGGGRPGDGKVLLGLCQLPHRAMALCDLGPGLDGAPEGAHLLSRLTRWLSCLPKIHLAP